VEGLVLFPAITAGTQTVDVVMETEQTACGLSFMWRHVVASFKTHMWGGTFSLCL